MIAAIFAFVLFSALLFISARNPRMGLYAIVFLAPWQGMDMDIGLRMTGYRIALAALIVAALLRVFGRNTIKMKTIGANPWLVLLIVYAVLWSIAQSFVLPSGSVSGGEMRSGQMRSMAQIVMFGLTLAPLLVVPYIVKGKDDILRCGAVYLWSVTMLAALGYLQLFIWYGTGSNPFPVGLLNSLLTGASTETLRSGVAYAGGVAVYRMNSFAGEPKGLATGLAVGLLILQVLFSTRNLPRKMKHRMTLLWGFLMLALILTWSTSGAFLWLIGTLTLTASGMVMANKGAGRRNLTIGVLLIVFIAGGAIYATNLGDNSENSYSTVAKNRFIDRNPIEDFDEAVLGFLKDNPEYLLPGTGLGNVHLYASPYIPSGSLHYMKNTVFVAKSGYLRIASELGVVGLMIFMGAVYWWLSRVKRISKIRGMDYQTKTLATNLYLLGAVLFIGGMARTYIWPQMFVMLGLCVAFLQVVSRTYLMKLKFPVLFMRRAA